MNKEKLKVGDILQTQSDVGQLICYVNKILPNKVRIIFNGKRDYLTDEELKYWYYANPIKDNRIVDSKTFAIRFKQFLDWIPKEFYMSGPHILEEYEYMQAISDSLLKYQIQTATDESEIDYLKRLNLL